MMPADMSDRSESMEGARLELPGWFKPAAVLAFLLILAGGWLQSQSDLNHHIFHVLNEAAGGNARWSAGLWSGLSVAGLGLSAIMMVLALDRTRLQAISAGLWCAVVGGLLTYPLKTLFGTPRPPKLLGVDHLQVIGQPILHSPSMPSGHSLTAFATATILVALFGGRLRSVGWLLLAIAIAFSRIAVGAHWPSDVLAGSGLGLVAGMASLWLAQRTPLAQWLGTSKGQRFLAVLELVLVVSLLTSKTGYPAAAPLTWTLAFMGLGSAWSRWRHAREPLGTDASVSRWVVPCLVAGLLLSVLLREARWASMVDALRAVPGWAWPLAVGGLWGSYLLRAERLRREWGVWSEQHRLGGPRLTLADSLDLFLAHNAALVLLPMRAGEAGYPWLLNRRFGIPVAESVRSLIWLRLQDASVLGLLGVFWLAPGPWWLRTVAVALAIAVGVWLVPKLSHGLANRSAKWSQWQSTLVAHRGDALGWGFCVANWLLKLGVLGAVLAMLSGVAVWQGWAGAVAGDVAVALPVQAPAGLGSYEAAIWAAGQWLHMPVSSAHMAGAALAVHALSLVTAVITPVVFRVYTWLRLRAAV